jgi:hypothetical protein
MFTAVLLASRLTNLEMVTAFILLAVISFYLFPGTVRLVKRASHVLHVFVTVSMYVIASTLLYGIDGDNTTLFWVYQALVLSVWILGPIGLTFFTIHYKKSYRGPWDIVELSDTNNNTSL